MVSEIGKNRGLIIRLSSSTLNKLSFCVHSWMLILQRCPLQKLFLEADLILKQVPCCNPVDKVSKMWDPNRKDLIEFQLWVHLESALHLRCLKTLRASEKMRSS
jgi:hypothetical protein